MRAAAGRSWPIGFLLLLLVHDTYGFLRPLATQRRHVRRHLADRPPDRPGPNTPWPPQELQPDHMEALFQTSLIDVQLGGTAQLKTVREGVLQDCAVLTTHDVSTSEGAAVPCLLVPLSKPQLKLLQFTVWNRPQSKWTLTSSLNPLLVNRDGALFDNLPWASWTRDPLRRNRDAANNPIPSRYHLGKRDAYYRFLGKDWNGRAVAAWRASPGGKGVSQSTPTDTTPATSWVDRDESQAILARRLWEFQFREAQMDLAEVESELAVARQQEWDLSVLEQKRAAAEKALEDLQLQGPQALPTRKDSQLRSDIRSNPTARAPPYRGASGYAPLESKEIELQQQYASPFDLLKEILENQLQAEVTGAMLEVSGILHTTVGGALVLRRIPAKESITIAGETMSIDNVAEDFGNPNITGGTTLIIECDADEAIGMALACGLRLKVEKQLVDQEAVMCQAFNDLAASDVATSHKNALRRWRATDKGLSILREGQFLNQSKTERVLGLRSPRSNQLYDAIFEKRPPNSPLPPIFPTDNPIKSLKQYDELSVRDKAVLLQSLGSFGGRLPRPRVVRDQTSALDALLLPLIDESVRRQYRIREARGRGDAQTVAELESQKSRRQIAKEKALQERKQGNEGKAAFWDKEAEFLESLRADATQDEGSYSQWLDRDEWYERQRLQMAKRIGKSSFGTLLDGIDL